MMTTRELPPCDWPRLEGTELGEVWPSLDPACAKVIAVEEAGEVIGCVATILTLNAHGLYISPAHRGKAAVFRHLRHGLTQVAHGYGTSAVMTSAIDPKMRHLLKHLGAKALDGTHYLLPLEVH